MKRFEKLSVLLLCITMLFSSVFSFTFAEDIEFEEIEAYIGDIEEEEEETEYIVYFNDSVVSLYADEGKEYALMNEEELDAAIEEGVVEFYEENSWVYLYDDGGYDPKQSTYKWDVNMIKTNYAFDKGYTGSGVKVAVIDSGCNLTGDLSANILTGYNLVDGSTNVADEVGHGTMVAGQIAAEVNTVGFRGVAPNAKIVPIKIFEDKKAKVSLVTEAIYMAVDTYDCDVINMSLGGPSDSETLKAAVKYAAGKGVILVAASGNNGTGSYSYPASYEEVICVGAVDSVKKVCDYSQYNDGVDVCAPGGSDDKGLIYCISASSNDKYYKSKGTSFAAPLVSGIAAIFRGIDSDFSPEDFKEIIMAASVDLGETGYDIYYGYGLADIEKYLKYYFAPVGDNNADGLVTSADAKRIADYVIGKITSFVKEDMADVNEDGVINLLDAIIVARAAEEWDGYDLPFEN